MCSNWLTALLIFVVCFNIPHPLFLGLLPRKVRIRHSMGKCSAVGPPANLFRSNRIRYTSFFNLLSYSYREKVVACGTARSRACVYTTPLQWAAVKSARLTQGLLGKKFFCPSPTRTEKVFYEVGLIGIGTWSGTHPRPAAAITRPRRKSRQKTGRNPPVRRLVSSSRAEKDPPVLTLVGFRSYTHNLSFFPLFLLSLLISPQTMPRYTPTCKPLSFFPRKKSPSS